VAPVVSASAFDVLLDLAREWHDPGSLHVVEGVFDHADILDRSRGRDDAQLVILQKVAQVLAADEVQGWRTVPGGFIPSGRRERGRGDEQALLSSTRHRPAEVAHRASTHLVRPALALEVDGNETRDRRYTPTPSIPPSPDWPSTSTLRNPASRSSRWASRSNASGAILIRRSRSASSSRARRQARSGRCHRHRHHDLTGLRTQAICRLHALLCSLIPGGASGLLSAERAGQILRTVRPAIPVEVERKRIALDLLGDVRRFDNQLVAINERIVEAVLATGTTVTDIHGIGSLGAAIILGHTGDIARFPTSGHYARYNGSAPIAASSGPRQRHRLNPRGNRQLNRALHVAAVTQVRNDTQGRAYYRRKLDEGKSTKEALRALKRQIAKAVYRHLVADTHR
jgi:transposase